MKVAFRSDSSLQIGTGHIMRCLTLAESLQNARAEIVFICREIDGHLIDVVESKGFACKRLPVAKHKNKHESDELIHSSWLTVSQQQDAEDCVDFLNNFNPDWLIVDHYGIDYRWQDLLKPYFKKLMVIDDLADRQHNCDVLLDQTYNRSKKAYQGMVPEGCRLLIGSKYALLRPEFSKWRQFSLERRQQTEVKTLLLTMGGVDQDNVTGKILRELKSCSFINGAKIIVVMGQAAPHLSKVRELVNELRYDAEVLCGVNNMAELMAKSDLAIGAAGATTWERFCLGLPTVQFALAANQLIAKKEFEELGLELLDARDKSSFSQICKSLELVSALPGSSKLMKLVDGKGRNRVVQAMKEEMSNQVGLDCNNSEAGVGLGGLLLLPLTKNDIEQVRVWRNSERILDTTVSKSKISKEQQIQWFKNLSDKDHYFKILFNDSFIGVASLKYDNDINDYDPGIFIGNDDYEGMGLGFSASLLLIIFAFDCLSLGSITARILNSNKPAIRMNKSLGYTLFKEGDEYSKYLLLKETFNSKKKKLINMMSRMV